MTRIRYGFILSPLSNKMGSMYRSRLAATIFVVTGLILSSCGGGVSAEDLQGVTFETPVSKPSFTLTDTEGNTYDFARETEGKLTLLYFGYINCPDICPVHLAQIAESFDQLPDVGREAEVVFVGVDRARDTPEAIREYLDTFDSRFVGLTGTDEELVAAQQAFGVPIATKVGDGDDYTINHAAQVFAFAPDGLGYSVYPFGVRQSQWTNDLKVLAEMTGA